MSVEDRVREVLESGKLEYDKDYTAKDLRQVWDDAEYPTTFHNMFTAETAATSGEYGTFKVEAWGGKRHRMYKFIQPQRRVKRDETQVSTAPDSTSPRASKNDHPEDRHHTCAHVAWYIHRGCVAVSMPKTMGKQTGKHEHPDMIGVVVTRTIRSAPMLPGWMQRASNSTLPEAMVLAAEVKHKIEHVSTLFEAVRECRHNTRYFDEGWLIADIGADLHAQARDLGEEYNIGVISVTEEGLRSVTLWTPRHAARMRRPQDYFARFEGNGQDSGARLVEQLSNCKYLAESMAVRQQKKEGPAMAILEQLYTSQQQQSLVERLPETIKNALKSDGTDEIDKKDIQVYATVLFAVFDRAYLESPSDDNMSKFYTATLGRTSRNALVTADYFGDFAKKDVRRVFQTSLEEERDDLKSILEAEFAGER